MTNPPTLTTLQWLDKHKGVAALLGGFMSTTVGATWWLAKGGAAAFITSLAALSDPQIALTLSQLPNYHQRVESALDDVKNEQRNTQDAVRQLTDALESFRTEAEAIVDWAPEHSQRLTDAVGGCFAGDDCQVFFRGRRTQAGAACVLTAASPRIILASGEEYPILFSERFEPVQLTTEFQTIPVWIEVPDFIPAGTAGVVVMNLYADCPFAAPGVIVSRETFRLLVEIKVRD